MNDEMILDHFWSRNEEAIEEASQKYGPYCRQIARNILGNPEDTEEILSSTWLRAWRSIPPARPAHLGAFLGKITRNLSLDRYRRDHAQRRVNPEYETAAEELDEVLTSGQTLEDEILNRELRESLNTFVKALPAEKRRVFLQRYWYLYSITRIAGLNGFTESKVKMMLSRTRADLHTYLDRQGLV